MVVTVPVLVEVIVEVTLAVVVEVFVEVDVDVIEVLLAVVEDVIAVEAVIVVLVVSSVDVVVGGAIFPIIIPNHNISMLSTFKNVVSRYGIVALRDNHEKKIREKNGISLETKIFC